MSLLNSLRAPIIGSISLVGAIVLLQSFAHAQTGNKELIAKGQYIFALAGGCACHTVPKGTPHAGGRAFPIPFGTVYSTNITQDKETGLGDWTDQQIHDAMTKGIRRDGSRILPVMPYEKYSGMAQEDLKALIAYLRTMKPVKKATPELKTWAPFARSLGTPIFLKIFGRFSNAPAQAPQSGVERGRYLVDHVSLVRRLSYAAKFDRRAETVSTTWPGRAKRPDLWAKPWRILRPTKKPASANGNAKT